MSLVEIRKLRKKIRQIECLEQIDRELTADEALKVPRFNFTLWLQAPYRTALYR